MSRHDISPEERAQISEALQGLFDTSLIEHKNGLAYLPHEVVRQHVIDATDNCFDWSIDQVLFRDDGVTRRSNDRFGEPRRPHSMLVIGSLTIPGLGCRAGIGAHPLDEGAGEDAAYKSAESDAFKRAAMSFGVGLKQLYIDKGKTPAQQQRSSSNSRPPAQQQQAADKPMSIDEFRSTFVAAVESKDNAVLKKLVAAAGSDINRWTAMITASPTSSVLEWVSKQFGKSPIADNAMLLELIESRTFDDESVADPKGSAPATEPANVSMEDDVPPDTDLPPATDAQINAITTLLRKIKQNPDHFDFTDMPAEEAEIWIEALQEGHLPEGVSDPQQTGELSTVPPFREEEIYATIGEEAQTLAGKKGLWWKEVQSRQHQPDAIGIFQLVEMTERAMQTKMIDVDGFRWRMLAIIKTAVSEAHIDYVQKKLSDYKLWKQEEINAAKTQRAKLQEAVTA